MTFTKDKHLVEKHTQLQYGKTGITQHDVILETGTKHCHVGAVYSVITLVLSASELVQFWCHNESSRMRPSWRKKMTFVYLPNMYALLCNCTTKLSQCSCLDVCDISLIMFQIQCFRKIHGYLVFCRVSNETVQIAGLMKNGTHVSHKTEHKH